MKNKYWFIWLCLLTVASGLRSQVYLNLNTGVQRVTFTDEQWPDKNPRHQGYSFGFDALVKDGGYYFMPGMSFQKMSLFPVDVDFTKPYAEFTDIKIIKLPLRIGSYLFRNRFTELRLQGGAVANFLVGVDNNTMRLDEDFNEIFTGLLAGATIRVLFLTLGFDYEYGLSRVYRDKGPSMIEDKSKLNSFSILLGVQF